MKKFLAILLIPVFLLMTAGVAITSLYCKGQISEVGINVKACCKDVNKGGCCNTTTKIVKVEDTFVSSSVSFEINKIIDLYLPNFQTAYLPDVRSISYFKIYWDKAPPSIKGDLYILYGTLII